MNILEKINAYLGEVTVSDIQKRGKKIAKHHVDINKAYFELDGTVWMAGIGKAITNMGPINKFKKDVKSGKIKAKLLKE